MSCTEMLPLSIRSSAMTLARTSEGMSAVGSRDVLAQPPRARLTDSADNPAMRRFLGMGNSGRRECGDTDTRITGPSLIPMGHSENARKQSRPSPKLPTGAPPAGYLFPTRTVVPLAIKTL